MRSAFRHNSSMLLPAAYWGFAIYLMVPLSLLMLMSFKDASFVGFPITNWTGRWYAQVVQDRTFLSAVGYSVMIAAATTVIATIVGLWIAMLIESEGALTRSVIFALAVLPAVVPGLINAISMRIFIRTLDIPTGTVAIILGHTVHAVPYVVIMALTRLRSMPKSLVEAALDLGADNFTAFLRVTLPYLAPALAGGMVFCVLTSIDDFVRTFFLGGYQTTLPMLIFAKVQSGMSPEINAMATLVLIATIVIGLQAERLTRRANVK